MLIVPQEQLLQLTLLYKTQPSLETFEKLCGFIEAGIQDKSLLLTDLRCMVEEEGHEHQGKSAFYLLIPDPVHFFPGEKEIFDKVWDAFGSQITWDDLMVIDKTGTTVLWLLANHISNGFKAFSQVFEKFPQQLTAVHFLSAPHSGLYKGLNLFWWVARGVVLEKAELFLKVWQKIKGQSSFKALNVCAQIDEEEYDLGHPTLLSDDEEYILGKTALWWLANIATAYPEPFVQVWQASSHEIDVEDLLVAPEHGDEKGITVIFLLMQAAVKHVKCRAVVDEILERFPEIFSPEHLNKVYPGNQTLKQLFKQAGKWGKGNLNLIHAHHQRLCNAHLEELSGKLDKLLTVKPAEISLAQRQPEQQAIQQEQQENAPRESLNYTELCRRKPENKSENKRCEKKRRRKHHLRS